ncbi:MAG TPA: protein kinase [Phycisphaerae bacterium]|nr:protein kinase [Phycisphaerae bacterium]
MAAEHMDSRDERIGRILNEYLDRTQQGDLTCGEELLKVNPDLAEELRAHFGMVRQVSAASSQGAQGDGPVMTPPEGSLPGYEILGEIHRGGQGVVYQALQKATRRKVAIKVMREGPFASWRDRARFDREVQVLAALKHPSIVTIHDSGTASGWQFVVMDYVEGLPLNVWQSSGPRTIEQSLRLFVTICDAVNAAHIKGIIHRDLKPGNIRINDESMPHILDFGLAKVTTRAEDDDHAAGMTVVGQFVGSLPWSSPEQAQGTLEQIDTRTDVYALGVVLYQMLTGAFPYEVVGPARDVLNRIVSNEPVRPSTIRKEIGRDVEAIILKCLRKEPHRRYQTAGELGRDIERYLNGEPIVARSDSGMYLLGKMLRRYRVPVMVAAAFAILVGVSLMGSLSLWRRAVAERDRAVAAQLEQDRQRRRADAQAAEAEQARAIAERERISAQEQAEQLRRVTYLNRIALARNAYEQKSLTQVHQLLEVGPADLRGWEWYYLMRLSRSPTLLDIRADPECVVALSVSADGRRVVTGGCDGVIRLWDSVTGEGITELTGHTDQVNALAFSPDDRWIVSGGRDRTLRLWDAHSGSERILQKDKEYVNCVRFSPDGGTLVAGGQGRDLTFWDVQQGQIIAKTPALKNEISCVAYSPDGKQVVSGESISLTGGSSRISIWDSATMKSIMELPGHPGAVLCVAYSPDGRRIASGGGIAPTVRDARGTLKTFDSATGEEVLSLSGHEGFVDSVAYSPDGKLLVTAGAPHTPAFGMEADRTLKIRNATTGEELCTYSAHNHGGRAAAWSPDGTRIFSGGMDGRLKAWPSTTSPEAREWHAHAGPALRIVFSPDGRRIASSGGQGESARPAGQTPDNTVRVWDFDTGSPLLVMSAHTNAVPGLAWSPDGQHIASGSVDLTIRVWNSRTGEQELELTKLEGVAQHVAFSPDSTLLAGIAGRAVTVWKIADSSVAGQYRLTEAPLTIAFSPDGRWIATGSPSGEIKLWDHLSGGEYHTISAGQGLNGAWFSPDGATIVSAHRDGTIVLWDASKGTQMGTMRGPQRSVDWIDFSPDGKRIASCTTDMMLKVWDVPSASEVLTLRAHKAPVTCVKFSPDGKTIATSGQDGLVRLWEGRAESAKQPSSTRTGG